MTPLAGIISLICIGGNIYSEISTLHTHTKNTHTRKQFVRIAKVHAGIPRCLLRYNRLILNLLNSVRHFNILQSVDSGAAKRITVIVADIMSLQNNRNTTFEDVIWMVMCQLCFWLILASFKDNFQLFVANEPISNKIQPCSAL